MINGNTFSDPGQVIKTLRALESLIKKVNFATNPLYGLSWITGKKKKKTTDGCFNTELHPCVVEITKQNLNPQLRIFY